jgi:hypothetical protein
MLSLKATQFCESIRRNAANDVLFLSATMKQLVKLNIQLNEDLGPELYPYRLAMLLFILYPSMEVALSSTKLLTRHTISVLIEETLDGKSKEIIQEIARHVRAQSIEAAKFIEANAVQHAG